MPRCEPVVTHEDELPVERWGEAERPAVEWRTLLSADRTASRSLTMGVAELPPGPPGDFVPHRHAQVEAYYVLSGEGFVYVDGVEHAVREGSAVFLPGGAEHCAVNTGRSPLRVLYVFAADSFDEVEYEFGEPRRRA